MALIHKILLTCKDATLFAVKNQENALSITQKIQLKLHLFVCSVCKLFSIQITQLQQQCEHFAKEENTPTIIALDENITAKLREIIAKTDK